MRRAFGFAVLGLALVLAVAWTSTSDDASAEGSVNQRATVSKLATTTPVAAQNFKLTASDPMNHAALGRAVAIDGNTIVAGAPTGVRNGHYGGVTGAARVYVRRGGVWVEDAKLVGSDVQPDWQFGTDVAVSGGTVIVTRRGPEDWMPGPMTGAAYIYEKVAGEWTQRARLVSPEGRVDDLFGFCADIDGDTAVVGAFYSTDTSGWTEARTYVFRREGNGWVRAATLVARPYDVAVSGARIVVARGSDGTPRIFSHTATGWALDAQLGVNGDAADIEGDIVAIGDQGDGGAGECAGAVHILSRRTGFWEEEATLRASDATAWRYFGHAVALSGNTLIVGARMHWGDPEDGGPDPIAPGMGRHSATYVFERTASGWVERRKLVAWRPGSRMGNWGFDDDYAFSVALDRDTAVAGAPGDGQDGPRAGAAFVFNPISIDSDSPDAQLPFGGRADVDGELLNIRGVPVTSTATVRLMRSTDWTSRNPSWTFAGYASRDSTPSVYRRGARVFANTAFALEYVSSSGVIRSRGREAVVLSQAYLPSPIAPAVVRARSPFAVVGLLKPIHTTGVTRVEWFRESDGLWLAGPTLDGKNTARSGYSTYRAISGLPMRGMWRARARHWDRSHAKTYSGWRYVRVL